MLRTLIMNISCLLRPECHFCGQAGAWDELRAPDDGRSSVLVILFSKRHKRRKRPSPWNRSTDRVSHCVSHPASPGRWDTGCEVGADRPPLRPPATPRKPSRVRELRSGPPTVSTLPSLRNERPGILALRRCGSRPSRTLASGRKAGERRRTENPSGVGVTKELLGPSGPGPLRPCAGRHFPGTNSDTQTYVH